jgi:hypothetical protein
MKRFFADAPKSGLSDLVEGAEQVDLDDVVCWAVNQRFHVALSGRPVSHPSQVLVAERELVTTARSRADLVVVDTPPLLAVSDTSELIPACDAVLIVCRLNKTTVDDALRTSESLARLRARVLGVVGMTARDTARGGYYPDAESPRRRRAHAIPTLVRVSGDPADVAPTETIDVVPIAPTDKGDVVIIPLDEAPPSGEDPTARRRWSRRKLDAGNTGGRAPTTVPTRLPPPSSGLDEVANDARWAPAWHRAEPPVHADDPTAERN